MDIHIFRLIKMYLNSSALRKVSLQLKKNATDVMKESCDLNSWNQRMDFDDFCASVLSDHQLKALDQREQRVWHAYEVFEKDGNGPIVINEVASEPRLSTSIQVYVVLQDWIRHMDGMGT